MLEQVGGQKEIRKGEKATFFWRFQNADYVRVDDDSTRFHAMDQTTVMPQATTTYTIKAITPTDTLTTPWTVTVLDTPGQSATNTATAATPQKNVQRGGETGYTPAPATSRTPSAYYSGYTNASPDSKVAAIRITRVLYPVTGSNTCTMQAVLLDENGNQLSGIPSDEQHTWSLTMNCGSKGDEYRPMVTENKWSGSEQRLTMALCVDRSSSAASNDEEIRKAIGDYPFFMGSSDKLCVTAFNHESTTITPFTTKDQLNYLTEKFGAQETGGLNAMYKACYAALQQFEQKQSMNNALVIVTSSSDNASLIYTADDVIRRAIESGTQIFAIAVGDGADSYPLKYMASQTGGRFYYLPQERVNDLSSILREITYSVRGNYLLQFQLSAFALRECKNASFRLSYESAGSKVSDKFIVASAADNMLPPYQALAMFSFGQSLVRDDYKPTLKSLAQVLKDNPDKVVELVGHSSAEGDEDAMRQIALERAQSVRRALYELGVNPVQLRSRALGDLKPVYYFQQNEWQKNYNRRVELRWLDPSVQPYEIVTEYVYTESDAIKYTEQWEKRGYKAYYERVLVSGNSAFRVKLWGYATEESALSEARTIEKKYSTKASVE